MQFYFNQESSLLLIGFTQGIVYSSLLLWRGFKERRVSDRILAILILVICVHISHYMLGFAGWFNSHDAYTTFMFYFPIENMLLVGPLVYYYFRSLTNSRFRFRKKDWLHFLPGFLHLGLYGLIFLRDLLIQHWIMDQPLTCFYETKGDWACWYESNIETPLQVVWAISILYYLVRTLLAYQRYRKYLNDNFSEQEFIRFGWLRNLLIVLFLGLAITWIFDLAWIILWEELSHPIYWNTHLTLAIVVYFIGIQGYHHVRKLKDLDFGEGWDDRMAEHGSDNLTGKEPNSQQTESSQAHSLQTDSRRADSRRADSRQEVGKQPEPQPQTDMPAELNELRNRLARYMKQERPFLNPELKMKELAVAMETNPSILSKVINTGFGQNFNDFINSNRVEAVKSKLTDPAFAHYSLVGIAEECGFNSKSTFNRAFKKFAGMSPREYSGR